MQKVLMDRLVDFEHLQCPACGWTGSLDGLVKMEVDFNTTDYLRFTIATLLASRPRHKFEYCCPQCGRLFVTHFESVFSYWDDWKIE
jgi:predicted RNA-binding Zn-ribbon protein involved in translation (DUF1610 family)